MGISGVFYTKIMKNTLLIINILLWILPAGLAQHTKAVAKLDSNHILIGDQVNLHISYTGNKSSVLFPQFSDSLQALEIISKSVIDTTRNNNQITLSQHITLTSFDSGSYEIPAITFYGIDSQPLASTLPLNLNVNTIDVDTTGMIKEIKEPLSVPLTWKEIGTYILLTIAVILLLIGLILLIIRLKQRKRKENAPEVVPKEAAHIIALKALEELNNKKLWQKNEYKAYYSELTDILRTYIFNRWEIPAMEMVSDEITDAIYNQIPDIAPEYNLQQTLKIADAVKFAKEIPLPDENSQAYKVVYDFVCATKLKETNNTGEQKNE